MDYGFHRVLEPVGAIPQTARKLDARPELLSSTEILLDVSLLNLDSTGMAQLRSTGRLIEEQVMEIVRARGKMHNPVSNSGGVLLGTVREIGPGVSRDFSPQAGGKIIPLVSTSTLPLYLETIRAVNGDQLAVQGTAVLFDGMAYTPAPADIPLPVALSILDISSIVPQVYRHVAPGQTVLVLGAGKSGAAAMAAIRKKSPVTRIIALDMDADCLDQIMALGLADIVIESNAARPETVLGRVAEATSGELCDVVLNCVNVPDTEATSILCARRGGTVVFYSMATRFDQAALGTDATDNDVRLIIGNGIAEGQAELALELFRGHSGLQGFFQERTQAG